MRMSLRMLIMLVIASMYYLSATAGVSGEYIDSDSLWRQGVNSYNAAKDANRSQDGQRAVASYVDALTYLSAYYQRSPELASSNSAHAKSVRTVLSELEQFLSRLSATGDAKGDAAVEYGAPKLPPALSGNLASPPKKSYSSAVFKNPRLSGKRLDWCRTWGKDCGVGAAHAFCKRHEFSRASNFKIDSDIGMQEPTKVIVGNQICNKSFCDGFSEIVCIQ